LWIALLAGLVLAERLAASSVFVGRIVGGVLIAWSIATLVV
jgi:predicted metal-binding membrane protein